MNTKILTTVSVIALMACGPALAKDGRTSAQEDVPHYNQQEVEEGWEKTKDTVSDAAKDVSDATKEAYHNTKDALTSDKGMKISPVHVSENMTAKGMIGEPVYNPSGERVAKVNDVILDQNGNATMVILSDGEWTGLGKMAAFDYRTITKSNADGDIIAPLTEAMMTNAAPFSYDRDDSDGFTKVIPSNGYSVAELLDADLTNPEGEKVANVDNISFRNGEADQLIVGYNRILGLGGQQASLDFEDVALAQHDGELDFQLSSAKAVQFEQHKKTSVN